MQHLRDNPTLLKYRLELAFCNPERSWRSIVLPPMSSNDLKLAVTTHFKLTGSMPEIMEGIEFKTTYTEETAVLERWSVEDLGVDPGGEWTLDEVRRRAAGIGLAFMTAEQAFKTSLQIHKLDRTSFVPYLTGDEFYHGGVLLLENEGSGDGKRVALSTWVKHELPLHEVKSSFNSTYPLILVRGHVKGFDYVELRKVFSAPLCVDLGIEPQQRTRLLHALSNDGVDTIAALMKLNELALLRMPQFGRSGLYAVRKLLAHYKLELPEK